MVDNGVLALFDIDGTLVRGARCHYQAFVHAVRKFYGVKDDISGINYAGKTDPQILMEVLELSGIKETLIKQHLQDCLDYMTRYYLANVHRENVQALGGVKKLLGELQRRKVLMGLTTGNLEPIAHAKLGRVGLDSYFPLGGFGSDYPQRRCLVKKAIKCARQNFGYKGNSIFVIGDTPRDVNAGKSTGALTIGVATGRYTTHELEKSGADFVLNDLTDKNEFLEIIF
ncbi:MAG: HAD family hydrolase [Euryarchaeota archaeon]|nr:HAD family hydrolase [Euryarchaeota archaeon]